jgi:hypothetical protein
MRNHKNNQILSYKRIAAWLRYGFALFLCSLLLISGISISSALAEDKKSESTDDNKITDYESIDYDLSLLNEVLATGQLQDIILHPKNYDGTVVRIFGQMRSSVNPDSNERHFAIYIMDPPKCCALLGIEFACKENAVYPDDFPEENTMITATGKIALVEGGRRLGVCLNNTEIKWEE